MAESVDVKNIIVGKEMKDASTLTLESKPLPTQPKMQFYKRVLPDQCIPFSSENGKKLFREALRDGFANMYFPLAEQFCTQAEPAYCGITTLVMVLNTLAVDPGRIWRGGWRWYHEEMLDCCLSLDVVQQQGITMEQFVCLATCNNLDLNVVRMSDKESIDDFRKVVKRTCSGSGKILVCSYSRSALGQTGDGHFSPIGAYQPEEDMVLIFDVARFKYPPHWVKLELLFESMKYYDTATQKPRGYMVVKKTDEMPLIFFRLSPTFRVTIATHNLLDSCMARFLKTWQTFLKDVGSCPFECDVSFENTLKCLLEALNEALSSLMEGESVFTTQFDLCCTSSLPEGHVNKVKELLQSLEETEIFKATSKWVAEFKENNITVDVESFQNCNGNDVGCAKEKCCRIGRVGQAIKDTNINDIEETAKQQIKCIKSNRSQGKNSCLAARRNGKKISEAGILVTESHFISMLLLCWPYHIEGQSAHISALLKYGSATLKQSSNLLQNEVLMLGKQIESLISMVELLENE